MIITLDLCLRCGGFSIISGLNLHIEKGEFIFICGQAGAGKSSLMRVLALQELPAEGRVLIDGTDVNQIWRNGLTDYRRTIGVIFQEDRLLSRRTIAENIDISLELAGWRAAEARRETNEYLKEIGLFGKADFYCDRISENERRLLKICRALARRPKIVLADEPYEGLDRRSAEKAASLFRKAHLRGSTIVIATHHIECAGQAGKRAIMLDSGEARPSVTASGLQYVRELT
ncbi:MAG: ATP-binding cassette domain-containing protein [Candidatus Abyssobacteria bacterium SURF_5]|uniref:ATP-binding cassette domain-containing protein n=1 Tax=Abyssobacteria bacterium (strain SURF_5) TaxID=2093360 RepID=A0A3A4NT84_ABYX5|nr:MAG: ATP-binding cassette domain-containing protein [Candidatus Abyssubacteria bacterium SURF_5]